MTAPERGHELRVVESDRMPDVQADWRTYVWQGPEWQKLLQAYGLAAWFVSFRSADDRPVGYALIQEHRAGSWAKYWVPRGTAGLPAAAPMRSLRVVHGPVIGDATQSEAVHRALAAYLRGRSRRWTCAEIVVKPPHYPDGDDGRDKVAAIYQAAGFASTAAHTLVLPANQPVEELRRRLAAEKRTKVNRAARDGIRVTPARDEKDVARYWTIRCETARRTGQFVVPLHHHLDTWRTLRPAGAIEIFFAELDGKDLAAQVLFLSHLDVELVGSATADFNIQQSLPGNDALQWSVIEWAHAGGYRHIDYVGANPQTDDPKDREIHRFKKSWGGDLIEYPQFVWRRPVARWLYRVADWASWRMLRSRSSARIDAAVTRSSARAAGAED